MTNKPKKVKAKITRTVTEIVLVTLNRDGNIEEIDEILDELDYDNAEVVSIHDVRSYHN